MRQNPIGVGSLEGLPVELTSVDNEELVRTAGFDARLGSSGNQRLPL